MADPTSSPSAGEHRREADEIVPLGRRSRWMRLLVAAVVFLLITAGTAYGQDDDFPFGPLRMFATRDDPNGTIYIVAVRARTVDGQTVDITNLPGAPRRADLEGQLGQLRADPALFDQIAPKYLQDGDRLRSRGTRVSQINLILQEFKLHNGRSSPPQELVISSFAVRP